MWLSVSSSQFVRNSISHQFIAHLAECVISASWLTLSSLNEEEYEHYMLVLYNSSNPYIAIITVSARRTANACLCSNGTTIAGLNGFSQTALCSGVDNMTVISASVPRTIIGFQVTNTSGSLSLLNLFIFLLQSFRLSESELSSVVYRNL